MNDVKFNFSGNDFEKLALKQTGELIKKELQKRGVSGVTVRLKSSRTQGAQYEISGPDDQRKKADEILRRLFR